MKDASHLEDLEVLRALKTAYAPDQGGDREHNASEDNLGFGLVHYGLVRNLKPDLALAIGSRYGFIPACLALALKANGKGRLHFVDANYSDQQDGFSMAFGGTGHWSKPVAETFGVLGLQDWVEVFIERTDQFFPRTPAKYGYIYIDANHSYQGVKFDCEQALQHLSPGGIISFHDAMVDETYADTLPEAAGFGVKAYLKQHFPNAIVLNHWPGLALVQPNYAPGTPADEHGANTGEGQARASEALDTSEASPVDPKTSQKHNGQFEKGLRQLALEKQRLVEKIELFEQHVLAQEEHLRYLSDKVELPDTTCQELRRAVTQVRDQLREHDQYYELIGRIRKLVQDTVPPNAIVLVVSKGDDQMLSLGNPRGWHFPQEETGVYAGAHPADSGEAIARLEELRSKGGQYLVFPQTALWWLESYPEFKDYLVERFAVHAQKDDAGVIFSLNGPGRKVSTSKLP